jgi:superfamily II DNA helicase RecQ
MEAAGAAAPVGGVPDAAALQAVLQSVFGLQVSEPASLRQGFGPCCAGAGAGAATFQTMARTQAFRTGQLEAVHATLSGRDSLLILPTGGGKSLSYQVGGGRPASQPWGAPPGCSSPRGARL